MREFMSAQAAIARIGTRHDPFFLANLIDSEEFSTKWQQKRLNSWCAAMADQLNEQTPPSIRYELEPEKAEAGFDLLLKRTSHGVTDTRRVRRDFFRSPEYRLIGGVARTLHGFVQPGASIHRGKASQEVGSFRAAYDWLMDEARKGRTIQRFKGLGEMNPDQLWETTVNPETRRLLQVTIEDAVAADEIFTTLMGDEVEPRRDFIESNALEASNIDV